MEVNRDAAEDCFHKGEEFLNEGNVEKAKKLFERSKRLYPLPNIDEYIKKCSCERNNGQAADSSGSGSGSPNDADENSGMRHRKRATSNAQRELVDRINHLKDYYEILGVKRDASDIEIKKAYRKLALQLHPDKNHEKGSEEAFKKVNAAFKVLSDAKSKREYDQFGDNSDNDERYTHYQTYEQNFDADDIFRAFFGGGGGFGAGGGAGGYYYPFGSGIFDDDNDYYENDDGNVQYFRRAGGNGHIPFIFRHRAQREEEEVPLSRKLLSVLPILVLFAVSIYINARENSYSFSTYKTYQYPIQRIIQLPSKSLYYYVKASFDPSPNNIQQVEARVLNEYKQHYYTGCYNEKRYRKSSDGHNCRVYQDILKRMY